MENIFKEGVQVVTKEYLGLTEDEYNNFIIDLFSQLQRSGLDIDKISLSISPDRVTTLSLNKGSYNEYNKLFNPE